MLEIFGFTVVILILFFLSMHNQKMDAIKNLQNSLQPPSYDPDLDSPHDIARILAEQETREAAEKQRLKKQKADKVRAKAEAERRRDKSKDFGGLTPGGLLIAAIIFVSVTLIGIALSN